MCARTCVCVCVEEVAIKISLMIRVNEFFMESHTLWTQLTLAPPGKILHCLALVVHYDAYLCISTSCMCFWAHWSCGETHGGLIVHHFKSVQAFLPLGILKEQLFHLLFEQPRSSQRQIAETKPPPASPPLCGRQVAALLAFAIRRHAHRGWVRKDFGPFWASCLPPSFYFLSGSFIGYPGP